MMDQAPIQRWLVLTEHGVELQPVGNRGLVERTAKKLRPFRRRTTVVTATAYNRAYGVTGGTHEPVGDGDE